MIIQGIVIALYTLALMLIFVYALAQLNLLINYLGAHKKQSKSLQLNLKNPDEVPFVTIQLPIYNELYVVERLLNNIANINYPKHKLEIQVLDDSTDASLEITKNIVLQLQQTGLNIQHIHRSQRTGFKAGALKAGLKTAKGAFIAIFDADFLPQPDWLEKTIPYFKDKSIGVVQTRWGHINRNYSLLTKVQAFALDAHFTLEQTGRNAKQHFINFNGTAGIWRKTCILDAGNWEGDTLTEDLDLSYRAQLKNWKFKYLESVETPAELPIAISAARSQQFRWNKGGAENFQKMFSKIFRNKHLPFKTKLHGFLHLLNSTMFLSILVVALLSVPMLYIKHAHPTYKLYFYATSFFVVSSVIFFVSYWVVYKRLHGAGFKKFIQYTALFFTFFSVAMGFAVHNSIAVLEGHFGKRSDFIRTPKFNVTSNNKTKNNNIYLKTKIPITVIFEGLLMLYFAFGMYSAFIVGNNGGDFGLFPFHLMLFAGFGFVFFKSLQP
ncbi:glycosyltransferase [Bizionia sediminis]|uniref:Glycosyltransferase n=1 Tax=Bizionia sediminis TaxID=1737064 RepID=A0ABW5KQM9_9FLAO